VAGVGMLGRTGHSHLIHPPRSANPVPANLTWGYCGVAVLGKAVSDVIGLAGLTTPVEDSHETVCWIGRIAGPDLDLRR
jgi:hypothetical protein